jgi:hypothetical protein
MPPKNRKNSASNTDSKQANGSSDAIKVDKNVKLFLSAISDAAQRRLASATRSKVKRIRNNKSSIAWMKLKNAIIDHNPLLFTSIANETAEVFHHPPAFKRTLSDLAGRKLLNQPDEVTSNKTAKSFILPSSIVGTGRLSNGVSYYIREYELIGATSLMLRLIINVGSVDELPNQRGYAHLIQKLAFKGTKNFSEDQIAAFFTDIRFSADKSSTNYDLTNYKLDIPLYGAGGDLEELKSPTARSNEAALSQLNQRLETALQLFADIISKLTFDEAAVEAAKSAVREEIKQHAAEIDFDSWLIEECKPYSNASSPFGTLDSINSATVESLRSFWNDHYHNNRVAVVILGNVVQQQVQSLLKRYVEPVADKTSPALPRPTSFPLRKSPSSAHKLPRIKFLDSSAVSHAQHKHGAVNSDNSVSIYAVFEETLQPFNMKFSGTKGNSGAEQLLAKLVHVPLLQQFVLPNYLNSNLGQYPHTAEITTDFTLYHRISHANDYHVFEVNCLADGTAPKKLRGSPTNAEFGLDLGDFPDFLTVLRDILVYLRQITVIPPEERHRSAANSMASHVINTTQQNIATKSAASTEIERIVQHFLGLTTDLYDYKAILREFSNSNMSSAVLLAASQQLFAGSTMSIAVALPSALKPQQEAIRTALQSIFRQISNSPLDKLAQLGSSAGRPSLIKQTSVSQVQQLLKFPPYSVEAKEIVENFNENNGETTINYKNGAKVSLKNVEKSAKSGRNNALDFGINVELHSSSLGLAFPYFNHSSLQFRACQLMPAILLFNGKLLGFPVERAASYKDSLYSRWAIQNHVFIKELNVYPAETVANITCLPTASSFENLLLIVYQLFSSAYKVSEADSLPPWLIDTVLSAVESELTQNPLSDEERFHHTVVKQITCGSSLHQPISLTEVKQLKAQKQVFPGAEMWFRSLFTHIRDYSVSITGNFSENPALKQEFIELCHRFLGSLPAENSSILDNGAHTNAIKQLRENQQVFPLKINRALLTSRSNLMGHAAVALNFPFPARSTAHSLSLAVELVKLRLHEVLRVELASVYSNIEISLDSKLRATQIKFSCDAARVDLLIRATLRAISDLYTPRAAAKIEITHTRGPQAHYESHRKEEKHWENVGSVLELNPYNHRLEPKTLKFRLRGPPSPEELHSAQKKLKITPFPGESGAAATAEQIRTAFPVNRYVQTVLVPGKFRDLLASGDNPLLQLFSARNAGRIVAVAAAAVVGLSLVGYYLWRASGEVTGINSARNNSQSSASSSLRGRFQKKKFY